MSNILYKIKNGFYKFIYYLKINFMIQKYPKRIFLLGTPWHGNIGDQALVISEKYILNTIYLNYKIIEIPSVLYNYKLTKLLGLNIKSDDTIFIQGGGNLGTLYINEEIFHRDIVKNYPNNKIVIMPMSIYFHNNDFGKYELKISKQIYNKHKHLTIISRDEISYNFAKKHFYNVKNIISPDSVLSLEDICTNNVYIRKGICFFLRKDIEKIVSDESIKKIKQYLKINKINYILSDTANNRNYRNDIERKTIVLSKLDMAKKSKLVITDRYHGVIFSVITHTPVIVFKSFDTKISSGVKWFNNLEWVHYIDSNNITEILNTINFYCLDNEYKIQKTNHYKDIIFDVIRKIREGS